MGGAWRGEGLALGWTRGAASWAAVAGARPWSERAWAEAWTSWADGAGALTAWAAALGWSGVLEAEPIHTPRGRLEGGAWFVAADGARLRVRAWEGGLEAPRPEAGRGAWERAEDWGERVLGARGEEPAVLLLAPQEARLVVRDALGLPSVLVAAREACEVARALWVAASPAALAALPAWVEDARRWRLGVIERLSGRACRGLVGFLQALMDDPRNEALRVVAQGPKLGALWDEARAFLVRLLFVSGLEEAAPSEGWGAWRGEEDAGEGLRGCFARLAEGGGSSLFGGGSLPWLDGAAWGAEAVKGLWAGVFEEEPELWVGLPTEARVAVAEKLVSARLGWASEPLVRLRRGGVESVVPVAEARGAEVIEAIEAGRLFARAGLGRKEAGAYYTPKALVRFLVREALGPLVERASPPDDPHPARVLGLSVVDPAVGGGAFLAEACRFLGEAVWRGCLSLEAEARRAELRADQSPDPEEALAMLDRAEGLRGRLAALGLDVDPASPQALARCRWAVAARCLYGVDREPLAVALTQAALWMEAWSQGRPLPSLEGRVVLGDALTGPSVAQWLGWTPATGEAVPEELRAALLRHLQGSARDAGLGRRATPDLSAPAPLDTAPWEGWRALARCWAGATMLGAAALGEGWPEVWEGALRSVGRGGLGGAREGLAAAWEAGEGSLAWELAFPEVFFAQGSVARAGGFDAVLSNPPWEVLRPTAREALAAYDLAILDAPTKRERAWVEARLEGCSEAAGSLAGQREGIERRRRALDALYRFQKVEAGGGVVGGQPDLFRAFLERGAQVVAERGWVGALVPATFHTGEGATGVRRLYMEGMSLRCCLSFENRRRLFDGIDPRVKFDLVVARKEGRTWEFEAAFGWTDPARLADPARETLRYPMDFVRRSGGAYLTLVELRGEVELSIARACAQSGQTFGEVAEAWGVRLGRELDMTHDADRFTPAPEVWSDGQDPRAPAPAAAAMARGWLLLHEGKTFHQYSERWGEPARYAVEVAKCEDKPDLLAAAQHPRLALRAIASASNERTVIAALVSAGAVFGNSALCERAPQRRPLRAAWVVLAVLNSFVFDWLVRQRSGVNVNLFLLRACPFPALIPQDEARLAEAALRLTCAADSLAYGPLWREAGQEGEPPALDEAERAALRAGLDAEVARAYGLTRGQLEHLLGSFSHKRDPDARGRVLRAFEALVGLGEVSDDLGELEGGGQRPPRPLILVEPSTPALAPPTPAPAPPTPVSEASPPQSEGLLPAVGAAEARAMPERPARGRGGRVAEDQLSLFGWSVGVSPKAEEAARPVVEPPQAEAPQPSAPPQKEGVWGTASPTPDLPQADLQADLQAFPQAEPEDKDEAKRRGRKPKPRTDEDEACFARVLDLLRAKGALTSQDAQREVGLDADAVRPHLQRLVDEGHASTSGQRRGLRYHAR